jgi:carboxymethylenebutenolidase
MQLKKASDFNPEVLKLFDEYVHGFIDRRGFLSGASKYAVGGVTAAMLLDALNPKFAAAQQVAKDDKRINTRYVEYPSPQGYGTIKGYLATPANASGKLPTMLVVHENRGLNPHIEDIARRLALDNFQAFAPDALTPFGGYPGDEDKARDSFGKLDQAKTRNDFIAAVTYLKSLPSSGQKIGAIGFCYGGSVVNMLATRFPDLGAAVPFYGGPPPAEEAAKIRSPLQAHYAGNDARTNAGWPVLDAALKANGVEHEMFIYPGVEHGFNNDTTPRYDDAAAKLAWQRTIAFLKKNVSA